MDQMGHWILKNCAYFWPKIYKIYVVSNNNYHYSKQKTLPALHLIKIMWRIFYHLGRQFLIMSSHNSLLIGSLNDFSNCIVMKYAEIFFFLLCSLFSLFLISCQYFAFSPKLVCKTKSNTGFVLLTRYSQ